MGCEDKHHSHGYCIRHLKRLQRYGDPLGLTPEQKLELRTVKFWSFVNIRDNPDECWEWTGGRKDGEYGNFYFPIGDRKERSASRIAYYLHNQKDPAELQVCHRCDNPPCCNPGHLFLGTLQENIADMVGKNRNVQFTDQTRGKRGKLDRTDAMTIKRKLLDGVAIKSIAEQHHISTRMVRLIRSGKRWLAA
jgi:hypothetical protein